MAQPPIHRRAERRRTVLRLVGVAIATIALLAVIATAVPFPEAGVDNPSPPDEGRPHEPEEEPLELPGFDIPYELLRNLILAAIGLIFLGAVVYAYRLRGGHAPTTSDSSSTDNAGQGDRTPVEAVADSAGQAAHRLREDGSTTLENEVYEAWYEMTAALPVRNPDTTTPAEFAAVAKQVGMAEGDVDELTRLFEDVRYGGAEVTATTEQRAVELFERIETTYAGDNS